MAEGKASTRAKNKYNAANYDRLYPYVPKGRKDIYVDAAQKSGMSLNEFMILALDEKAQEILQEKKTPE